MKGYVNSMNLESILGKIEKKKILVIGDVMLDRYFIGNSKRLSQEAPVPILLKTNEKIVLGGAANVAYNLKRAGQDVSIMTVVGADRLGNIFKKMLKENGINSDFVVEDKDRSTTVKTRFIGQNNTQMFRYDEEDTLEIHSSIKEKMQKMLIEHVNEYDLVIISDYNKGLLKEKYTALLINICNKFDKKVLIDIKEPNYEKYRCSYLIKPNLDELANITKMPVDSQKEIEIAAKVLREKTGCNYVLVTRGKDGMTLVGNNIVKNYSCLSREVYDVTGAGDTVISYLAVGLANNIDIDNSIQIANSAAGVKVGRMGTYGVTIEDIIDYINVDNYVDDEDKLVTVDKLVDILGKKKNKKVVFTNGCFDIFHIGHAKYLKESSCYGDILVVGVNSDKSVKRLKGENRPINNESDRMEFLASLSCVSYVVKFDEDTPYELIKKIQPDIITKAGDYKKEDVVGKDIVEARGGSVVICKFLDGKSTTGVIEKILNTYDRAK